MSGELREEIREIVADALDEVVSDTNPAIERLLDTLMPRFEAHFLDGAIEALERWLEEVDSLCLDGGWAYTGEAEDLLTEIRTRKENLSA